MRTFTRVILIGIAATGVLCLAVAAALTVSNRRLPTRSQSTDQLSALEKARLAEVLHLQRTFGNAIWPGWGEQDIPIIVYNEDFAFLVGYDEPPHGWTRMPQKQARGGPWEAVPGDDFEGEVYYRQRLPGAGVTPENFTVLVGDRWVATMEDKEYMEINFYSDFKESLPAFIRSVFPLKIMWGLLMGETENYIQGLEHESFHAFQGSIAAERLAEAEFANQNETEYPWNDVSFAAAWKQEGQLLAAAVRASTDEEAYELVRQYLASRDERRTSNGLSSEQIDYERQREWLEGLAKYVEVEIGRLAGEAGDYQWTPGLEDDPDFNEYTTRGRFWSGQVDEVKRSASREGETRFYYGGMAQAMLLDRLTPGWKERALEPGVMLEDLLREAINR